MRIKLKHVNAILGRDGKVRYYVRRRGFKNVKLPGLPLSAEFMAAYDAALVGERIEIGARRVKHGTVAAIVNLYLNSIPFGNFSAETQRTRRNILNRFSAAHGDKPVALLQLRHINTMIAAKAHTPSAARNFLATIRLLMQFAIKAGIRSDDPTVGAERIKIRAEGFRTWTEEDIAQFEAAHAIGTRARLALALLLYTGQRRSDVVRMGRQHIHNGAIQVRQQKTGAELVIPMHPDLKVVLDATSSNHLTFLITAFGKPFTAPGFTNWFRQVCNEAGLPKGTSAHGLRKAMCRRLAEAGCSANEIKAISGHVSLREVERYTKAADQVRMGCAAINRLRGAS